MASDTTTVTNYDLDKVIETFDSLLENLQIKLKEFRPRSDVKKTKLWTYRKQLHNLDSLSNHDAIKLLSIVMRYNSLNVLFDDRVGLQHPADIFNKLIEGEALFEDRNQKYNDVFFELSMAVRFLQPKNGDISVNLMTECDLVINDFLAIECKYLHSEKSAKDNILEAFRQIKKRVDDGMAEVGIVSLDISFILKNDNFNKIILSVFNQFIDNYKKTFPLYEQSLIKEVILDSNFNKICSSLINHFAEILILSLLDKEIYEKMHREVICITYQVQGELMFEKNDVVLPVPYRMMSYKLNHQLSKDEQNKVTNILHSLSHEI